MTGRLRVLLLPSVPYEPLWRGHARGENPIATVPGALLRAHGIACDLLDPGAWPRNPFGRMHPFYRAFDPVRLARAWFARRRYDLVVSGNDAAAFGLISLRRLFGGRTPIAIWDFSPATT